MFLLDSGQQPIQSIIEDTEMNGDEISTKEKYLETAESYYQPTANQFLETKKLLITIKLLKKLKFKDEETCLEEAIE